MIYHGTHELDYTRVIYYGTHELDHTNDFTTQTEPPSLSGGHSKRACRNAPAPCEEIHLTW